MRRGVGLMLLAAAWIGLAGCSSKDKAVTEEAEATNAQMSSPEMDKWYKENANKTPNAEGSSDAIVTGQGVSGAPAQSGAPATN